MKSQKRRTIVHSVLFLFLFFDPKPKGRRWPRDSELPGQLISFAGRRLKSKVDNVGGRPFRTSPLAASVQPEAAGSGREPAGTTGKILRVPFALHGSQESELQLHIYPSVHLSIYLSISPHFPPSAMVLNLWFRPFGSDYHGRCSLPTIESLQLRARRRFWVLLAYTGGMSFNNQVKKLFMTSACWKNFTNNQSIPRRTTNLSWQQELQKPVQETGY